MRDHNFLIENNTKHMWQPMAHPAEAKANPPRSLSAPKACASRMSTASGDRCGRRPLEREPRLFLRTDQEGDCRQLQALPYYSSFRGSMPTVRRSSWHTELRGIVRTRRAGPGVFHLGRVRQFDTALRLARQYHKIRGEHGRTKFLSLKKGYHGTHWGGASVNGNANFRTTMNRCCRAASTFLPPTPIATRSTKPIPRGWPTCRGHARRRDRVQRRRHDCRLHHGADPGRRRGHPAPSFHADDPRYLRP